VKNVTISLPDPVYRKARVLAAERDMSLSAFVRELVLRAGQQETEKDRGKRKLSEVFAEIAARHPEFRASDRMSRDEVHDRDALRREYLEHRRAVR
jgi:predicted CopG family antitoxin